jgi:hypothetical protein
MTEAKQYGERRIAEISPFLFADEIGLLSISRDLLRDYLTLAFIEGEQSGIKKASATADRVIKAMVS